jgi:hypothetical protein
MAVLGQLYGVDPDAHFGDVTLALLFDGEATPHQEVVIITDYQGDLTNGLTINKVYWDDIEWFARGITNQTTAGFWITLEPCRTDEFHLAAPRRVRGILAFKMRSK